MADTRTLACKWWRGSSNLIIISLPIRVSAQLLQLPFYSLYAHTPPSHLGSLSLIRSPSRRRRRGRHHHHNLFSSRVYRKRIQMVMSGFLLFRGRSLKRENDVSCFYKLKRPLSLYYWDPTSHTHKHARKALFLAGPFIVCAVSVHRVPLCLAQLSSCTCKDVASVWS